MSTKAEARASYYSGARAALQQLMVETEAGLRALHGLADEKADKLVAAVRKRHNKLLAQLDRQEAAEGLIGLGDSLRQAAD